MFGVTISEDNTIGLFTVQLVSEQIPTYATIERLQEVAVTAMAGSDAIQIEFGGDLYNVADEPETGVGEAAGPSNHGCRHFVTRFWQRGSYGTTNRDRRCSV